MKTPHEAYELISAFGAGLGLIPNKCFTIGDSYIFDLQRTLEDPNFAESRLLGSFYEVRPDGEIRSYAYMADPEGFFRAAEQNQIPISAMQ